MLGRNDFPIFADEVEGALEALGVEEDFDHVAIAELAEVGVWREGLGRDVAEAGAGGDAGEAGVGDEGAVG